MIAATVVATAAFAGARAPFRTAAVGRMVAAVVGRMAAAVVGRMAAAVANLVVAADVGRLAVAVALCAAGRSPFRAAAFRPAPEGSD